jgi:hypothetical protein
LTAYHPVILDLLTDFLVAFSAAVEVYHGDFLDLSLKDWRDADVVFANSTCFDDVLMSEIAKIGGITLHQDLHSHSMLHHIKFYTLL